jgi:hypothetical protein
MKRSGRAAIVVALCGLGLVPAGMSAAAGGGATVLVLTKEGRSIEGTTGAEALVLNVAGKEQRVRLRDLRSFHSGDPAVPGEAERITAGLAAVAGTDFKASEAAAAELSDIGLPVLTPLLRAYKDTDAREPNPLYRLFARIVPGFGDGPDRAQDLARLASGDALRGKLAPTAIRVLTASGTEETIPSNSIRRLAVRQASLDRVFELQALRHCTYVSFLDTGVCVTPETRIQADSAGYVRLSFDEDGWASDPDGIKDPLPGKRRLQEGFRWGAVLGRVGPRGERWLAGRHVEKTNPGTGRLYFVVNDNEHWQNNIGSYRVHLRATNVYDVGEAQ